MSVSTLLKRLMASVGLAPGVPPALAAREDLSIDEIAKRFFPDLVSERDSFRRIWSDLADALEVPAGRVRPADRPGEDLPLPNFFGATDSDAWLGISIAKRKRELGIDRPVPDFKTVEDYVRFFFPQK